MKFFLKSRLRMWLRRYALAEVCATAAAFLGFHLAQNLLSNRIISAYAGALSENIAFYGVMAGREIRAQAKRAREQGRSYGWRRLVLTTGHLGFEFGFAEIIDSLMVRPFSLGIATRIAGDIYGVFIGKFAADIVFYAVTMVFYELRLRHLDGDKDGA